MTTTQENTSAKIASGLRSIMTVANVIKASGQIPADQLHVAMPGCKLSTFESIIRLLAYGDSPIIERRGGLLVWKGWNFEKEAE